MFTQHEFENLNEDKESECKFGQSTYEWQLAHGTLTPNRPGVNFYSKFSG